MEYDCVNMVGDGVTKGLNEVKLCGDAGDGVVGES